MPSTIDTIDSNALSELENLSDSDWLDIASSRASEDTDSIAGFDSDPEDSDGRPSSRRSFTSVGSSRDGEIQGWEGLVEDSADESPAGHCCLTSDLLPSSARLTALGDTERLLDDVQDDPEEEQRVKDALDQSMMSTLSSSRSNSLNGSAVQTSIVHPRDLRLSFPDPLTSPRDALLNTSYENIPLPLDNNDPPKSDVDAQTPSGNAVAPAPPTADPGSLAISVVPEDDAFNAGFTPISPDFYVVLYGSSSSMKWSLIEIVLEKMAHSAGLSLSSKLVAQAVGHLRYLAPREESCQGEKGCIVSVVDRTESFDRADDPTALTFLERPSLAVVFLPSAVVEVPDHTLYLPVLAQNFAVVDLPYSADQLLDAEQQWEMLGIGRTKRAVLSRGSSSVIDQEELERARPLQVSRAFRPLFDRAERRISRRPSSTHAFTIFAVLSIVLGCVLKGSLDGSRVTHTPTNTTPTAVATPHQEQQSIPPMWGLLRPISINQSVPPPTISTAVLVPSSFKDYALAVLNPSPFIASASTSRESATLSTFDKKDTSADVPSECACGCGLITWPMKLRSTTDLMLRPTPPSPALTMDDYRKAGRSLMSSLSRGKGKGKALVYSQENLYALSTRLAGSLSQYIDVKAVAAVVRRDLQEILDAIDELVRAISRHTAGTWEQSKGTVHVLREEILNRHERAQRKARELKELGGQLLSSVGEQVRGRMDIAKENARALRERVLAVDVWSTARAQREEAFRVRKTGRERRKERREKLRRVLRL